MRGSHEAKSPPSKKLDGLRADRLRSYSATSMEAILATYVENCNWFAVSEARSDRAPSNPVAGFAPAGEMVGHRRWGKACPTVNSFNRWLAPDRATPCPRTPEMGTSDLPEHHPAEELRRSHSPVRARQDQAY